MKGEEKVEKVVMRMEWSGKGQTWQKREKGGSLPTALIRSGWQAIDQKKQDTVRIVMEISFNKKHNPFY